MNLNFYCNRIFEVNLINCKYQLNFSLNISANMITQKDQNRWTPSMAQDGQHDAQQSQRPPELSDSALEGRNQGSIIFQRAAENGANNSLTQVTGDIPEALDTPGATSSVRLSDTNLNADDLDQLQELHQIQHITQNGAGLDAEKGTDAGNEDYDALNDGKAEPEDQKTPRMHPLEYLRAEAEKDAVGQPQEALGGADGQSEREFQQKRELTCIEEELMDYSPTRSLPSLVAPSQGDLARLSQSRKLDSLQGALRGSIRESNPALNRSVKWPEAALKERDDGPSAARTSANVLMTPMDARNARGLEEMNMGSPDPTNYTDRSNPIDPAFGQRSAQQQEHMPGGIQHLMRPYSKPTLQKKMTDLKMASNAGQQPAAVGAQDQILGAEAKPYQSAVVSSPGQGAGADESWTQERRDEAMKEPTGSIRNIEDIVADNRSQSMVDAIASGNQTQDGLGLSLNDGLRSVKAFQTSMTSTPQGPNPQSQRSSARQTGPQADTKLTQPKKRNKSFNQWRQTQQREKSANAKATAAKKSEEGATQAPEAGKTDLLGGLLSQTKLQLQAKRSPEPRALAVGPLSGLDSVNLATAQYSSNQQTPEDGSATAGRTIPLTHFHIFQSVGLQDILQRDSSASTQQKVPTDLFYNNPAQSVIVNVESPSPEDKRTLDDHAAKPDSMSMVVEPGKPMSRTDKLGIEKQKTENQRRSRDKGRASDTVPDMVFTEADARSSAGLRSVGLNSRSLAVKAPQIPGVSSADEAYYVPSGQATGPVGIDAQDASHILKNLSSHVDSDHDEQADLLNQMLGLPGDPEKGNKSTLEIDQQLQNQHQTLNENTRKLDNGQKRPELRKSQAIVKQKFELQKQMYFQTTSQRVISETESGHPGPQDRVHAQSQVQSTTEKRMQLAVAAAQPSDAELQQRISEALRASQTPGRAQAHHPQYGENKSLVTRVLSPQTNNQHLKVIHNRPALSNSKNSHHHRFGSKTSLGTYNKAGKQESRFEHTSSSQFQHQKAPVNISLGSFIQKEGNSLGRRKQSAVIQSSHADEASDFRLKNQKNEQPGPRLLTTNTATGATISLAAVTASVRSTSKEKIDLLQPQHAQKRPNTKLTGDAQRLVAQRALQVSEQQLDRYQQEYLERLNRVRQAESQKGTLDAARPSPTPSSMRSGGARVRNARSPCATSTQQAIQIEKAGNVKRKQLGSPTSNAASSLQQARLSESVLQHSRTDTSAGRYGQSSALGTQKAQKMQIEWKQICKLFDSLPQGTSLKGRYSFSRNDIISVVSQFRRKIEDLEALVQYEQQKNIKQDRDYNGLLEELKEVKIEKRHYQEQLNRIPDLEIKIEQQSQKLTQCVTFLKKCMVSSVVCLEFNKDIQTLINKFQYGIRNKQDPMHSKDKTPMQQQMQASHWQGVQEVVKAVSELQEQHHLFQAKEVRPQSPRPDYEHSFSANIDLIEGFINDLIQFQQSHTVYEKVVKVDLENMSSGTDDDDDEDEMELDGQGTQRVLSEDEDQQLAAEGHRHSEMNHSQHDSEICRIKIKAESMYNYNPTSANIDTTSQHNNDHYTQLAGKSRKELDESASTRVKQSPLTVAPSPQHRGDSAKQKKQATAQATSKRQPKSIVPAQSRMTGSMQKPPIVTAASGSALGFATISVASRTSKGAQAANGETQQPPQPPRPSTSKQTRKSRQSRLHKKGHQPGHESKQQSSIHPLTSPGKSESKTGGAAGHKGHKGKGLKGPVTEEAIRELNREAAGHYEKVMQELQSKKLQYSVLLEKYEHKARRVMELQDEVAKFADFRNEQEIRRQCQEQFSKLESQYAQLALKNEGLQQQIRDYQKEIYQQEQTQQSYQQQIDNLKTYMQTQHQLLQEDERVADLEKAVITLCNNQLAQKFENITSTDKQMLQAIFGDGFLIQNQMRADLVRAREVAQFLLNDVALEIFNFFEKLDRHALQKGATQANQAIRLANQKAQESQQPQQCLYYEKAGANDAGLALGSPGQPPVYSTQARKAEGSKTASAEHGTSEQMTKSASQNRQSGTPALGFVSQLQQKKGKNMEADLNFNLFNDNDAEDSPRRLADAIVDEPKDAYSAAKRAGTAHQQSPRENAAMTNRSTRSMNTMKSGERKSVNARRTSQLGSRAGHASAQAALLKRISQQNKFLDEIKGQLQVMYDRHEAFNDFIFSDEARESLLRHISVAARKPGDFADERAFGPESQRPRVTRREEDSSMVTDSQFLGDHLALDSRQRGYDSRRAGTGANTALDKSNRARNTVLKFTGGQLETLTGGGEPVRAEFVTERGGLDESMAMLPQSTSQFDQFSQQLNTSSLHEDSHYYPPGYEDAQRQRLRPNQNSRHLSTHFP